MHKTNNDYPVWKLSFQLRSTSGSEFKTYPIGQQIFYSDLKLADNPDSVLAKGLPKIESYKNIIQTYTEYKFKSPLFEEQSIIKKAISLMKMHTSKHSTTLAVLGLGNKLMLEQPCKTTVFTCIIS